jgi:hypothetical protein
MDSGDSFNSNFKLNLALLQNWTSVYHTLATSELDCEFPDATARREVYKLRAVKSLPTLCR